MATPIPVTVLGGYLGAGKTTLVNAVLAAAAGRRIAVIVNDFGALGIDAALLAERAEDGVIDLPNGCICCTIGNDLAEVLDRLSSRSPRPDHIVIEASGVADPAALAAWGTVPGFAPGGVFVLAAADGIGRLVDDRYVGGEVRRQLAAADLIVLTKTDLVGAAEAELVRESLASSSDVPVVIGDGSTAELVLVPADRPTPTSGASRSEGAEHGATYASWSWVPPASDPPVPVDALGAFVDALPPSVLRAKGVVATTGSTDAPSTAHLVQVVGPARSITPIAHSGVDPTTLGLVVIGLAATLDVAHLDRLAATHLGGP